MKAPSENQRLLSIVKSLVKLGPFSWSSICHSYGLLMRTMMRMGMMRRRRRKMICHSYGLKDDNDENEDVDEEDDLPLVRTEIR